MGGKKVVWMDGWMNEWINRNGLWVGRCVKVGGVE